MRYLLLGTAFSFSVFAAGPDLVCGGSFEFNLQIDLKNHLEKTFLSTRSPVTLTNEGTEMVSIVDIHDGKTYYTIRPVKKDFQQTFDLKNVSLPLDSQNSLRRSALNIVIPLQRIDGLGQAHYLNIELEDGTRTTKGVSWVQFLPNGKRRVFACTVKNSVVYDLQESSVADPVPAPEMP